MSDNNIWNNNINNYNNNNNNNNKTFIQLKRMKRR